MPAEMQNIKHKRGSYRVIKFGPVKNPLGDLVPLAGANATWRMSKHPTSSPSGAEVFVTKDTASNGGAQIVISNWYGQDAYTVHVTLNPQDTVTLIPCTPPNRYYHECEVTTVEGHPIVVATGWFDLQPSITN
jgi:hypothetical protein